MKKFFITLALAVSTAFASTVPPNPALSGWTVVGYTRTAAVSYRHVSTTSSNGTFTFEMRFDYKPGTFSFTDKKKKTSTEISRTEDKVKASCSPHSMKLLSDTHFDPKGEEVKDYKNVATEMSPDIPIMKGTPSTYLLQIICEHKDKTV